MKKNLSIVYIRKQVLMKDKFIKWNWKLWLLLIIFLAQVFGYCDFLVSSDLNNFSLSGIFNFLSVTYLWLINCSIGLILFMFSTLLILPNILKKRISERKAIIAYLGIPFFLMFNLVSFSWNSRTIRLLGLFHSRNIAISTLIFLSASLLTFILVWVSIWVKKRRPSNPKLVRLYPIAFLTITISLISAAALMDIFIYNMKLFPEPFGVITPNLKETAQKWANPGNTKTSILSDTTEKKEGDILTEKERERPNLIFISIDTLRADHLSCYSYNKLTTHNIDALAQKGVRFAQAYTSIPITLPSHSSMMTGLYPSSHGAINNGHYLMLNNLTLAEILKSNGFTTAAFISAFPLSAKFNFNQGFDYFNNDRRKWSLIVKIPLQSLSNIWILRFLVNFKIIDILPTRNATEVNKAVCTWLNKNSKNPFFIFIHFWDPHIPYVAPRKYRKLSYHPNTNWLEFLKSYYPRKEEYAYNSEIAYVDNEIGKLISFLKGFGLLENSIIVFISDHGEGLDEHNYKGHTDRVYEEQLHVPLFIIYPSLIPEGKVIKQTVNIVNIMPTILDMLKIPAPTALDGSSLMPLINEKATWNPIPIYATAWPTEELPFYHLGAIIKDDWKLICHLQYKKGDQLYFLKDDPEELNNLAKKEKKIVSELKPLLLKWVRQIPKGAYIKSKLEDKETIERLKALGYIN
jgi:arylsulfatase A-like enzyme